MKFTLVILLGRQGAKKSFMCLSERRGTIAFFNFLKGVIIKKSFGNFDLNIILVLIIEAKKKLVCFYKTKKVNLLINY